MAVERDIGGLHILFLFLVPTFLCISFEFVITGYPLYPIPALEFLISILWFWYLSKRCGYKEKHQRLKMGGIKVQPLAIFSNVPDTSLEHFWWLVPHNLLTLHNLGESNHNGISPLATSTILERIGNIYCCLCSLCGGMEL